MNNKNELKYVNVRILSFIAVFLLSPALLHSQAVKSKGGVKDSLTMAKDAVQKLAEYELIIEKDSFDLAALRGAATLLVAMVELEPDRTKKLSMAEQAVKFASLALTRESRSAESHFVIAQSLGRVSELIPIRGLENGPRVYKHALQCLEAAANHGGCLHIVGAWHGELCRRGKEAQSLASMVSGNKIFKTASWDSAQVYLERATVAEPEVIIHRLTLGRIYKDRDKPDLKKAKEQFEKALKLPVKTLNDLFYVRQVREELASLKSDG